MWSKGLPLSVMLLAAFYLLYVYLYSLFPALRVIHKHAWL